jgi:hypothetical protein
MPSPDRTAHTDDGVPIRATNGRPPKPSLSPDEWAKVIEIMTAGVGVHGSSLERAALEVSLMRGAHSVTDKRTQKKRQVSGAWILRQLRLHGIDGKKDLIQKHATGTLTLGEPLRAKHDSMNKVNA